MTDTATPASADALTPANILAPASVPPPVPAPESNAAPAKPEAAPAPDTKAADQEGPADEAANDDQKDDPKRKASFRIGELYAQKKAAEREAGTAWREVDSLRKQLADLQANTNPDDWQQQQRNDVKAAVKEERLVQALSEAQQKEQDAVRLRQNTFEAKLDSARERITDLDAVMTEFQKLPVSDFAAELIVESDKAAEIAYYLAKNPQDAFRIANMAPHLQGREIARIEAKVSPGQARKTSNAPPPVPMVGASSAPSSPALKDMGVDDIGKLIYGR